MILLPPQSTVAFSPVDVSTCSGEYVPYTQFRPIIRCRVWLLLCVHVHQRVPSGLRSPGCVLFVFSISVLKTQKVQRNLRTNAEN